MLPTSLRRLVHRVPGKEGVESLKSWQRPGFEVAEVGGRSPTALSEAAEARLVVLELVMLVLEHLHRHVEEVVELPVDVVGHVLEQEGDVVDGAIELLADVLRRFLEGLRDSPENFDEVVLSLIVDSEILGLGVVVVVGISVVVVLVIALRETKFFVLRPIVRVI